MLSGNRAIGLISFCVEYITFMFILKKKVGIIVYMPCIQAALKESIKNLAEILLREVKLLLDITQILKIRSNLQFLSATLKTFWELGSQVPALFPPLAACLACRKDNEGQNQPHTLR